MVLRLVLVRHGLSSFNKDGFIQGRTNDSYLTDEGYHQAKLAGNVLKGIKFDKIYSSPLKRAAETAKTIESCFKDQINIEFDQDLLEVNLESWTGLTFEEVKNNYPSSYEKWKNDPENLEISDKDNNTYYPIKDLYIQANNFIQNILNLNKKNHDQNILIVAHNAILRCLILSLINKPRKGFRKIKLDNASISILNISKKNGILNNQVQCLNETSHLQKSIPDQIGDSRIILVRHGETNWNKEGRFQGQIDIPLNQNGKNQAERASLFLKDIKFNKVFSSSMSRPYETAEIILKNSEDLTIKKLDNLVEISHGLWEGKLESEIKGQWPELIKTWHLSPEKAKMPEGESIGEVSERSVQAWNDICLSQKKNDITLIVAHDAVNKTILCNLLGLNFSDIWMIKQGNGGISVIDIFTDSSKDNVISSLNITSHLGSIIDKTASGAL